MRLLIISTGAGTGHVQAAAALEEAARRDHPHVEVLNVDALDYGTPFLRDLYARSYELMANRIPALWGYLFNRFEAKPNTPTSKILGTLDRHNARALLALVRQQRPDRIVCTHFLPASALSRVARAPIDVVVTDFNAHAFWIQPGVRRFFVAADCVRQMLVDKGIDEDRVSVHGIPVSGRFLDPPDRGSALDALGLRPEGPVLLAMGGGFGRRGLLDIVGTAVETRADAHVLAVAGRSRSMHDALTKRFGDQPRVRIYRFIQDIEALMIAADLIVTKPGGLTTSEALAVGRPLVLTTPVPGQEELNAEYLTATGAAVTATTEEDLRLCLSDLLANPARLAAMADAAGAAGRPRAASRVVQQVLENGAGGGPEGSGPPPENA